MRLSRLHIESFKNLNDFEIDFDSTSVLPHTILLGGNGSGKSNLIEALVSIFSSLQLDAKAPFSYTLSYLCNGKAIEVHAKNGEYPTFKSNKEVIARNKFNAKNDDEPSSYLPRFTFGYYSGASDRFNDYFVEHQRIFYRKLKAKGADPNKLPFRPLFLAKPSHGQFVLLAFFSKDDPTVRKFLADHLGILDLESVLFVIKKPGWQNRPTEDRFWEATGIPRSFLDNVFRLAVAPFRQSRPVAVDYRERPKTVPCWNLFLDRERFNNLANNYERPQDFFKTLESTEISDLLMEVVVTVRVRNVDGSISFRELSEGEQQLLLVLGLLRFTNEEESLFLLDEPDTHLNPAWSVQYLRFLEDIVGRYPTSHIVMATHDPLVFAGLTKKEVRVMRSGDSKARPPDEEPRGMGIEAILTSELFGLRSTLDLPTQEALDRKRRLQARENRTSEENTELHDLTTRLAGMAFTTRTGDPLYPLFVQEMVAAQERELLLLPVLTPAQQARRQEIAREVVERLRKQRDETMKGGALP